MSGNPRTLRPDWMSSTSDDDLIKVLNELAAEAMAEAGDEETPGYFNKAYLAYHVARAADRIHDLQPQEYRMSSDEIRTMRAMMDWWKDQKEGTG